MKRLNKTTLTLIGFAALGLSAFAQEPMPQQQPQTAPASREAMAARRQAMQRLTADFSTAVKNANLPAEDQQRAQAALAQLGPHVKGAPRDPQARRQAMKTVRQMSTNPAFRPEDRDLLAKDLAAITPVR
jgi:hypothetical protein